jgi:hypothetical protein
VLVVTSPLSSLPSISIDNRYHAAFAALSQVSFRLLLGEALFSGSGTPWENLDASLIIFRLVWLSIADHRRTTTRQVQFYYARRAIDQNTDCYIVLPTKANGRKIAVFCI